MSKGVFNTAAHDRYLEDFVEGDVHEFGPITITEDEIVRYGRDCWGHSRDNIFDLSGYAHKLRGG